MNTVTQQISVEQAKGFNKDLGVITGLVTQIKELDNFAVKLSTSNSFKNPSISLSFEQETDKHIPPADSTPIPFPFPGGNAVPMILTSMGLIPINKLGYAGVGTEKAKSLFKNINDRQGLSDKDIPKIPGVNSSCGPDCTCFPDNGDIPTIPTDDCQDEKHDIKSFDFVEYHHDNADVKLMLRIVEMMKKGLGQKLKRELKTFKKNWNIDLKL